MRKPIVLCCNFDRSNSQNFNLYLLVHKEILEQWLSVYKNRRHQVHTRRKTHQRTSLLAPILTFDIQHLTPASTTDSQHIHVRTRQNDRPLPPPTAPPDTLFAPCAPPALPTHPHPHTNVRLQCALTAVYFRRPHNALQRAATADRAADTRHEGAQLGQEAVRWVQEREEEEGKICVYYLQQESEA
jgi:hypothetical protein